MSVEVVEVGALQKDKWDIIILECQQCGNELETDVPRATINANEGGRFNCSRCGKFAWTQIKSVGKRISNDPTAPTELINKSTKIKGD